MKPAERGGSNSDDRGKGLRLIYDGDIGPDPTDFTVLSMLHEYHERAMIDLVGVIGSTPDPLLASTFSIYNRIHGHDVPIGVPHDDGSAPTFEDRGRDVYSVAVEFSTHSDQNEVIARNHGDASTLTAAGAPEPVELYRDLLSGAEHASITIFVAGPLFNLPALLDSPADRHSPLTGEELVAQKVRQIYFMGGNFPNSAESALHAPTDGAEYNWWALGRRGVTAAALQRLAALGTPMTYIGSEVGEPVLVGREVVDRLGRNHPTSEAYFQYRPTYSGEGSELSAENPAFDDVALFHIVEGGMGTYFGEVPGRVRVDDVGVNTWDPDAGGDRYLTLLPGVEGQLAEVITDRVTGQFAPD